MHIPYTAKLQSRGLVNEEQKTKLQNKVPFKMKSELFLLQFAGKTSICLVFRKRDSNNVSLQCDSKSDLQSRTSLIQSLSNSVNSTT